MEIGGYPILNWLGFGAFMIMPTVIFYLVAYYLELGFWKAFPPPKANRKHPYNQHSLYVVKYWYVVWLILFLVASVCTFLLAEGVIALD